ncbi:toll/interleukin-1 receptor domain-containing protein [Streptomyces sp. NPDC012623]|uniref:toll/interleukin-1 receptor domain-containing protein n=1 Tax=unclassified Streptomyces TaxID=2593676 RepID=UPI003682C956
MHEIFINYRTEGGKDAAFNCHEKLSSRFGEESVFLAGKSIELGSNFTDVLIEAVRRSRVLLALIDENWLDAPDRSHPGRRALTNRRDWVRREIEEALRSGILVVPLMTGRRTEQLDAHRLPASLAEMAECQYERLSLRSQDADMARLGDRLVRQVPALAALDRRSPAPSAARAESGVRNQGQSGGIGQVTGAVGTYVHESHAPLHTGTGDQVRGAKIMGDGDQVSGAKIVGDGTNHVAGDNHGGFRQQFGSRGPGRDGRQ